MKVTVAGAGPGGFDYYTQRGIDAVKNAEIVITSKRLSKELEQLNNNVKVLSVIDTVDFINSNKERYNNIVIVASGDTGFYSIASTIKKQISSNIELDFISGISSMQYFMSKLQLGYENAKLVSLHGKEKSIIPFVCYNKIVFALTGGSSKAHDHIKNLIDCGLNNVVVYIGENLASSNEKIVCGTPEELSEYIFDDLSVMIVYNDNYVNKYRRLKDDDFIRGKSPMTKEAVRNLTVDMLEISPEDIVYDIGAGTGSVSIAMANMASESMVFAIEKEDRAVELIYKNIQKLGAYNIRVIAEKAPLGLDKLPPADKVFIGGSTGNLREIVSCVLNKNAKVEIVVNAVTLETLGEVTNLFNEFQMEAEIFCVNISKAEKLGRYNLMKSENPVYIIKGENSAE